MSVEQAEYTEKVDRKKPSGDLDHDKLPRNVIWGDESPAELENPLEVERSAYEERLRRHMAVDASMVPDDQKKEDEFAKRASALEKEQNELDKKKAQLQQDRKVVLLAKTQEAEEKAKEEQEKREKERANVRSVQAPVMVEESPRPGDRSVEDSHKSVSRPNVTEVGESSVKKDFPEVTGQGKKGNVS